MWGHACVAVICACACGRYSVTSVRCLCLFSSMCRTSEINGRCVHLRGSDRCEISYAATLTRSMCRSTFEDLIDVNFFIGASLSEPHTYRTAVQNRPYIHGIYTYAHPSGVQFGPAMGPFKRATRKRRTSQ